VYFGTKEYLQPIQDVAAKGPNGESLYLGYKYSFYSFIMPYALSDDGYILGVKDRDVYYRLDQGRIAQFQAKGLLPTPLPPYELSAIDYVMGHLLWGVGVVIAAVIAFQVPGQRRRKRATAFLESALGHTRNGDLDSAIADYTRAIDIDPKLDQALINRGAMYDRRRDYDHAIADYTRAIAVSPRPGKVLALVYRGLAHHKKGDLDRAIADYSHAIELGKEPAAWLNRGYAFADVGDYDRAIADYTKVIELEPNATAAYEARASAHAARGDADRAQADRNMAVRIAGPQGFAAA
jgi:tetratricopeptide (TPR) repeat protein